MLSTISVSRFAASVALIWAGTVAGSPLDAAAQKSVAARPASAKAASAKRARARAARTIVVRMLGDASGYRFQPAAVTAHVGDVVRFINVSGGPHNVAFWDDRIPSGTAETLQKNMQETMAPLSGALLTAPSETFTVSLAGLRPGTYHYYCVPHLAVKMVGSITVRP